MKKKMIFICLFIYRTQKRKTKKRFGVLHKRRLFKLGGETSKSNCCPLHGNNTELQWDALL